MFIVFFIHLFFSSFSFALLPVIDQIHNIFISFIFPSKFLLIFIFISVHLDIAVLQMHDINKFFSLRRDALQMTIHVIL